MKYLKLFNEELTSKHERLLTTEMVAELRDFCRVHLAYLIDEGFSVQITPTFNGTECDVIFYKNDIFHNSYRWVVIKDHFITFLYMLNKYYNIINSSEDHNSLSIQPNMVSDIINDNNFTIKNGRYGGSFRDDKLLRKIKIKVDFKEQSITEAVDNDTIDLCCVDLYDQGFELKGYKYNLISLQKQIVSDMPEWDGTQGTDVRGDIMWKEHLSKYQPCNITIKGKNFNQVSVDSRAKCVWDRTKQLPFTEEEKELVSKVSDIASILSHYNGTERKEKLVEININSRPSQNPVNFQYEKYLTRIDITFYL